MLSRKTLGVAGAAILGSMALLATNTASAAIDLDKGTGGVKVAKETLLDTATTTPTGTTTKYYDLVEGTAADGAYDLTMKQGIVIPEGATLYLRIELMNMVFNDTTATIAPDNAGTGTASLLSGATDGGNTVIVTLVGAAGTTADDVLTIPINSISVLPDAAGSVKTTLHRESLDASLGTGALRTVMADNVVQVVDGLEEKSMSSGAMADVSSGFAMFDGNDKTSAQIGYLRIKAMDKAIHRAGTAVRGPGSFLGVGDAITATFKGDFSNHTFKVYRPVYPAMNCTGETSEPTLSKDKDELKVVLANSAEGEGDGLTTDATANPQTVKTVMLALCVEVAEKNTMAIPDTEYTATVKYMKLANAMFPRADQTLTIGSIGRTGTTVQIPYLTTYEGYNQRIVLSNRGSAEAEYMITFRPEAGVMATAGEAAEGMLAPMSTVTLSAMDVVMLEGGSRTAATVTVVADKKMIDVTSVTVNKETRGTDTVVHHSGGSM